MLGPRPRVPLPWEITLLWNREVTLVDFCNLFTTHEHTLRACPFPHTRVELSLRYTPAPLRTPVALALRYVAASKTGESHPDHDGLRAP
jgi:hypothetical protein